MALSDKIHYGLEMNFWKKDRINYHREYIEQILENPPADIDWRDVMEDHQIKTSQFQHERLVHYLVTMTIAIGAFISACFSAVTQNITITCLLLLLLVLLFPYVLFYFMLENNTQAMYPLYDRIREKIKEQEKNVLRLN